jgi:hypothetical protein
MRYSILFALLLLPTILFAQEDWSLGGPLLPDSWVDICGGGFGYGICSPSITSNDSMIFFSYWCNSTGVAYSIFRDSNWQTPSYIPTGIISSWTLNSFFSERDSILYFEQQADSGGFGGFDIWATQLNNGQWCERWNLGLPINTTADEECPSLPLDCSRLYFSRNGVIMCSEIAEGNYGEPVDLPDVINSPAQEHDPIISSNGQRLYFNRGINNYDPFPLNVSMLSNGVWQDAYTLSDSINYGRVPGCFMLPPYSSHPTFSCNETKMYWGLQVPIPPMCDPGLGIMVSSRITGINELDQSLPENIVVSSYPNPFNASTLITVKGEDDADIAIYDIQGRCLTTLHMESGKAIWNAEGYSSGIYFARVENKKWMQPKLAGQAIKLILLK